MTFRCPREWNLTLQQMYAVEALVEAERLMSVQDMGRRIRCSTKDCDETDLARVVMCKVRRKLAPFGIEISTVYAKGYFMDDQTKAALLAGAVSWRKDAA